MSLHQRLGYMFFERLKQVGCQGTLPALIIRVNHHFVQHDGLEKFTYVYGVAPSQPSHIHAKATSLGHVVMVDQMALHHKG